MIKKLSSRIFLIIMVSLGTVILGIIILFAILNYRNTINTATSMMDRFMNGGVKRNDRLENDKIIPNINLDINLDGVYNVLIEDDKIIQNSGNLVDKEITEYAIKVSKLNKESGIIGNYIYKTRRIKTNTINVMLMENEEAILQVRVILISSICISIFSLIIIYVIAKKISKSIVQPVSETFEKQKQFIQDASHELKTPLAVIEANADVLENEVGDNKWLRYIQNEVESMNKLINELLLLAKMENIDNVKEYQQLNLSKEVEIILSMFESMAYEKQVSIKSKIAENIIIDGNKEDMEHIVSTLTDNAIKHTEAQKEVEVILKKEKNEIILEVKNMGNPIPEEEKEKIFERFYRVDKSRNRKEKRYGLGLAIAKSTVEKYNGKIEVLYKDGFTVFKVTIPN